MTTADPSCPNLAKLVSSAEDGGADPDLVFATLTQLLDRDAALGAATALGILSRGPRIKPSFALLIDPGDTTMRRWRQRVAAGAALIGHAAAARCRPEVLDELSDCPELAIEVVRSVRHTTEWDAMEDSLRARLLALAESHGAS